MARNHDKPSSAQLNGGAVITASKTAPKASGRTAGNCQDTQKPEDAGVITASTHPPAPIKTAEKTFRDPPDK